MVVQDKPNYRDISQDETGSNDRKQRLRERFEVLKKLGQGTYGKVQLAINKETKQEVAIKTIKKAKIENEQDLVRIRREIQIMSSIHHPHIIHIYEVFENQEKIVLIMQYASGGELYDYLGCRKKLDENETRRIFRQVASAIFYCHKNHICHRDLKLENILLDDRGNAKIADFGLSNVFDEKYKLKTFCGSPLYASPEIVRGTPYCGPEVDCWSLGVLLYTLVYGAMPFDGTNFKRLVKQISEGEYFEPKEKSGASGLIRRLLTVDIIHRATIREICTDWWVNQGYDHSLLRVAADMANLTPVRADLLLAISSATSRAVDQSVKKETITTTEPIESISALCNGYYSKSHPLHLPENNGNRKRTVRTADEADSYNVSKVDGKKQTSSAMGSVSTEGRKDELTDHKKKQDCILSECKTMATTKTPANGKNESNTFIIVQDLIKDVISKVEQHINSSKIEFVKSNGTEQTQQKKHLGDCSLSQTKITSENSEINDDVMEREDATDILRQSQKSQSSYTTLRAQNRSTFLGQKKGITATETGKVLKNSQSRYRSSAVNADGLKSLTEMLKMSGIPNSTGKVDTDDSAEKIVQAQRDTSSERRKSIPLKTCDIHNRKAVAKQMEPDVVIPIFNVCSNIPKRSSDLVRTPSKDLKDTLRCTSRGLCETESKAIDRGSKSNDEPLLSSENKSITSTFSNIAVVSDDDLCKALQSSEIGSKVSSSRLNETFQHSDITSKSTYGSFHDDTKECQSQTEIPKLPPRKRFLIKIPKQEKSNEKDSIPFQSESGDSKNVRICDKPGNKTLQEKSTVPQENGKLEFHTVGNEYMEPFSFDKEKKSSVCSESEVPLTPKETSAEEESSPKLTQRKSRRDCGRRSLIFNAKTGINRESELVMPEKQNFRLNKREDLEVTENISRDLNNLNIPSTKDNEAKDDNQFPQSLIDQTNNNILKADTIYSGAGGEKKSSILEDNSGRKITPQRQGRGTPENEINDNNFPNETDDPQEKEREINATYHGNEVLQMENNCWDINSVIENVLQESVESKESKPLVRAKQRLRSLSRTRAMSLEFESLAQMPMKIAGPPKKPPGKVEIPKTFDPTQSVTSPKAEMKEIIFIPTACVSENKEKIQKKIERVKRSAIIIPPRRKSDAGVVSRKKKYTRSQTDFIVRSDDLIISAEDENFGTEADDGTQEDAMFQEITLQDETQSLENMDAETIPSEMWYSTISPDIESEECEQVFKAFEERGEGVETFDGFYNENDVTTEQNNQRHRHSVDTESGYWTPPEMTSGQRSVSQTSVKLKEERPAKKHENSEKVMLQRAAFKNSKFRMKLSDEGLDMCSLSSSLESGIYSWRQEDINGKRVSPDSESAHKIFSPSKFAEMTLDGSYAPIIRSFKKMTFPPEHSSTSELSENCSVMGDAEKNTNTEMAAIGKENRKMHCQKPNGVDSKPIKPSDSQSSYGSNDISDDVFDSWADKDVLTSKEKYQSPEDKANSTALNKKKNNGRDKKARNWQRGGMWMHSCSTDKESSDNDDDLDLMIDECHPLVYGTEGLWQFLKSVNQQLSSQLKTASEKTSPKPLCHRSKSQESKHPDDVVTQKRPVTRSLSREEKQRKGDTQLRHFVSEGKLTNADSIDCFEDAYARFADTRYSSGYLASGSSLGDSSMLLKDFMNSADSFQNYSDDVSLYGTLRRDKYFHSSSALSSPCLTRRKKSLQNLYSTGDLSNTHDNTESAVDEELSKRSAIVEQNRKLSLYGTLRHNHLGQQGRAQSQILLSTNDGYQLLYNERSKKDSGSETLHDSLSTLRSTVGKASSEINVSAKDYEKLLLANRDDTFKHSSVSSVAHRNTSSVDSLYHTTGDRPASRVKKMVSDKGIRRVSFSSDVKASKSDYHSSLRQNSLNKVREANEELHSSSAHKSNIYEEQQDSSGSLLEALKTYGYRGIMSQKLQSNPDKQEPRLNYRLPTDCFLSPGLNKPDWENFEYLPTETTTMAYQPSIYSPSDPMEYPQWSTFTKGSQIKRNTIEYNDLSRDDDIMFKDIFRSHRLGEEDIISRRKPSSHKYQDFSDLHLTHSDQYSGENWDSKHTNSARKKNFDNSTTPLSSERRNSGSGKIVQHEREREGGDPKPTDRSEFRVSKQTENSIDILSEKIQALKSRCQKKSLEESKLKKDIEDSGVLLTETESCDKAIVSDAENERFKCYTETAEALSPQENESESVSDRIWRKSFYSRFNDVTTVRKKKPVIDSELLSRQNFLRSSGKFKVDEEGGVEEPWMYTSLKRRNSQNRSLSRKSMTRTSSLSSDAKESTDSSSRYSKQGASTLDAEHRSSRVTEKRSVNESSPEQKSTSVCDKNSLNSTTEATGNISNTSKDMNNSDCSVSRQNSRENRTETSQLANSSELSKNDLINACGTRAPCNFVSRLEPATDLQNGVDHIHETTKHDITDGASTASCGRADDSILKNTTLTTEEEMTSSSTEQKMVSEENLEKQKTEGSLTQSTSAEKIDIQSHSDKRAVDKE